LWSFVAIGVSFDGIYIAVQVLFRLSHKRAYFFWSAFSVHATVFSGYSLSCMVVLELLLLLELPWLVVLAQLLCFLMLCLLAIVLPSFFSCYCKNNRVCFLLSMLCSLSLFFSLLLVFSSSELWRNFFQASVVVIFYALFALLFPPPALCLACDLFLQCI